MKRVFQTSSSTSTPRPSAACTRSFPVSNAFFKEPEFAKNLEGQLVISQHISALISDATHSFDQWYSLGLPGFSFNAADQAVIDIYTNALVNFAKTGYGYYNVANTFFS